MSEILTYMTPAGDFAMSCEAGALLPREGLIPAPEGGRYGMRYDGAAWIEDAASYARAIAWCYPESAPAPDSCTALQGRRALGMERVQHIDDLVAHLDLLRPDLSAEEIWVVQMAWRHAATWERLGHEVELLRELYGMSEEERDQFMRLAVTL
jgi:hypothetical protein